ncbi:MAG: PVC-type heme-binding CxxCH protein [Verrucomicrobiota bacterium]
MHPFPRRLRCLPLLILVAWARADNAPAFPEPYDTDPPDHVPISAAAAAASFRLPEGFKVSVFAAEPDVRQPISLTTDPRGRLWVVENFTYADAKAGFATNLSDRILIFADTNHDGHFDQRTVFWDQGKLVTSAEPGPGGVYVMAPPRLLFLPDRNGDDIPDGEPEVLLDGFNTTTGSRHTFANGLKWGPDGWLWGRVGISSTARAGRPGAPDSERVLMAGGIWRYHPGRRVVEAVAQGTTNPWGLDWNELGEPFFINTVIGHLWHAIPGAHFQRMYGEDPDPHSYDLIAQHADHYHFDTGAGWTKSRAALDGSSFASGSDSLGGGHAHSGLMFYLGTNWPGQYRDRLFTINLHGRRANQERIERAGLGFVGRHEADLFSVGDPWFRGLDLVQGPDGGVFVTDWSDTGECHDQDGIHRGSGRIYKITYGTPPIPAIADLNALDDTALVALVADPNEWLSRQSRRVLVNRRAAGKASQAVPQLEVEFGRQRKTPGRLRAIWALHAVGGARPEWLLERLTQHTKDANEYVRSWAVRLLADDVWPRGARPPSPAIQERTVNAFLDLARTEPSNSIVRLYLASALQHLPLDARASLASVLLEDPGIAADHNQGFLIWYGIEDLVAARPDAAVGLAISGKCPLVRKNVARWLAEDIEKNPGALDLLLARATSSPTGAQQDVVRGMSDALKGWRRAAAPPSWSAFAAAASTAGDGAHRDRVRDLTILFGDGRALEDLRVLALSDTAPSLNRRAALRTLIDSRAPNLDSLLRQLSNDPVLRAQALIALIQAGDLEAARNAAGRYPWLDASDRPAVLAALSSRPAAAGLLLDAVGSRQIPKADITPFLARQIASLKDASLSNRLAEIWGTVRSSDAARRATVERYRKEMSSERLATADLSQGRQVFSQLCAPCHRLYGVGAEIGPDLTGSGRFQLDYLLENLVDPSAVVPADYRMVSISLKDGRVLNGILRKQTDRIVTLQTQGEMTPLERADISTVEPSDQSMMPEGMLDTLSADQARNLLAYLMATKQVPLPGSP